MRYTSDDPGFARYVDQIKKIPMLTAERELDLVTAWREHGDMRARSKLIDAHLRLVVSLASKMSGYGVDLEELVAEGNIGLIRALETFDSSRGLRFSTYAMWWIRAMLYDCVVNHSSLVKFATTGDDRKLFFRLRRIKEKLGITSTNALTDDQAQAIATASGTKPASVIKINARLAASDSSLNSPLYEDGDDWIDSLVSNDPSPHDIVAEAQITSLQSSIVSKALDTLNPRERHIFTCRRLIDPIMTLEELGQEYGLTRERIRQIEAKALAKLTRAMLLQGDARRYQIAA